MGGQILIKKEPRESSKLAVDIFKVDAIEHGTVIAVGPGKVTRKGVRTPPEVKVGDKVMYIFALTLTESAKSLAHVLDEDEFLLEEKDILGVIE